MLETYQEQKARLKKDMSSIELIELDEHIRAYRMQGSERINVQGSIKDAELAVDSTTSLRSSLRALEQIAFYLHMGVRIDSILASVLIDAILEAIRVAEEDPNYGTDDPTASEKCLKAFGKKIGILAGNKRPKANFRLVKYEFDDHIQRYDDDACQAAAKSGMSDDEYFEFREQASEDAEFAAREHVKARFDINDQQLSRYLDKYDKWEEEQAILWEQQHAKLLSEKESQ